MRILAILVALGVVAGLVLVEFLGGVYNTLVRYRNRYQNAFTQIAVQLQRRYDLIPHLVETVKAYLHHEREILEAVMTARDRAAGELERARANLGDSAAIRQLGAAEGELTTAIDRLLAVTEAYPDLQASQNMQDMSEELVSTEDRIVFAREAFNDAVTEYNTYKQSFPAVVMAGVFGHGPDTALLEFTDVSVVQEPPTTSIT